MTCKKIHLQRGDPLFKKSVSTPNQSNLLDFSQAKWDSKTTPTQQRRRNWQGGIVFKPKIRGRYHGPRFSSSAVLPVFQFCLEFSQGEDLEEFSTDVAEVYLHPSQ